MKKFTLLFLLMLLGGTFGLQAQWVNHSINYDSVVREYRIYLPENYDSTESLPLILGLHGLYGTMDDFEVTGIDAIADTARFLVLAPQALDYNSPAGVLAGVWNAGVVLTVPGFGELALNADVDDIGFLNALVDSVGSKYALDEERIYLAGVSLGGFMAQRMACQTPAKFSALASIMGTYANALPDCLPTKVLPVAHFHGTDDDVVSWEGDFIYNGMPLPVGLSVDSLVAQWALLNECTDAPEHSAWPNTNNDDFWVDHYSYRNANQESTVELFTLNGGGHFWYSSQNTGGEIDLATEVWKFFNRQYYGPTTVSEQVADRVELSIYPNPTKNLLYINTTERLAQIKVIDLSGRQLFNHQGHLQLVGVEQLMSGNYWLQLITESGVRLVRPFTKL